MISWSWAFFTRVKKLILRERAAYAISSSPFVPLENYHLVTILGAAPSITYPRGQACARHSLRVHPSRYIPPFKAAPSIRLWSFSSFALAFLLNCTRGIAWFHSIKSFFVKRGIISTISEIGTEKGIVNQQKRTKFVSYLNN